MAVSAPLPSTNTDPTRVGQQLTAAQQPGISLGTPTLKSPTDEYASYNTTPLTEPTVLSSSNITDTTIPASLQKLSQYQAPGQTVGQEGLVRNADASFAEAPPDSIQNPDGTWSKGGLSYALGPSGGGITSDPATQSIFDQFTALKGQMDATSAANIENIKNSFSGLITQQQRANAGQEAATNALLMRGGSQFTASSAGIYNTQVSYGIQKISDLQNQENDAIVKAQQAQQDGDMKLLSEQLSIAQAARKDKQDAASKLNDTLLAARQKQQDQIQQASKDTAVQNLLSQGITDPNEILKQLQASGNTTISAKDIADTISNLNPDAKEVHQMLIDASKNGAPTDVLAKIGQAKTLADAVSAAGRYTTDPTSTAGMYQAAVAAGYKGTPGDFVAAQKYKEAYAAESAKQAFVSSSANQSKLFQQGVTTLKSELSNRSGGLGLQDAKVNQAIHLKALFDQYAKTITVQNIGSSGGALAGTHQETVYNIPASQYTELAMGVANLISPTNTVAEGTVNQIRQATLRGDINAAITYATGNPQAGSTQQVFQNLKDSVDRQGTVAEQERQTYVNDLISRLPPDLAPELRDQLVKSAGLNSYTNPTPDQMTPAQIDQNAYTKIQTWAQDTKNAALLSDISKQFPNLSNVEVAQKLGLIK